MAINKVVFISLFKYAEKKFNLPTCYRESYKGLFRYFRESEYWDFNIYENSILAEENAFYRIIEKEINIANTNEQQIIFFLIGRGQTLIRNKIEKKPLFGLYGYLPGKLKNSINIGNFLDKVKNHENIRVIIHSDNIEFDKTEGNKHDNFVCINDNLDRNDILHITLTLERIFRKIIDINNAFFFNDLILQLENDLNFSTRTQLLYNAKKVDSFRFSNYPIQFKDKLLISYLINNIYNPSKGSREDGFNDLKDLFIEHESRQFARERLKAMLKLETDSNLSNKIRQLLHNDSGKKTMIDFIYGREELLGGFFKNNVNCTPTLKSIQGGITKLGISKKGDFTFNEIPECNINISDFKITQNPITIAQYFFYLLNTDNNDSILIPDNWISIEWLMKNKKHPVTNVNYYDANLYCDWLTKYSLKKKIIKKNQKYRIPTEAEWEKVCRGKKQTIFPWGDIFEKNLCNTKSSGHLETTEIGAYKESGSYGCIDLIGNVWEWTSSLWGTSPSKASYMKYNSLTFDYFNNNDYFVTRGGAYYFDDECANCITRNRRHPNDKHSGGGFRVVLIDKEK